MFMRFQKVVKAKPPVDICIHKEAFLIRGRDRSSHSRCAFVEGSGQCPIGGWVQRRYILFRLLEHSDSGNFAGTDLSSDWNKG
jgi:hypothetical protein